MPSLSLLEQTLYRTMCYINNRYMSEKRHIVYMENTYTCDGNATNINPHNLDMFRNLHNLVFHASKIPSPNNHQRSKNPMETSQASNSL